MGEEEEQVNEETEDLTIPKEEGRKPNRGERQPGEIELAWLKRLYGNHDWEDPTGPGERVQFETGGLAVAGKCARFGLNKH